MHSRIIFYVYAKIGQANGGAAAPPWIRHWGILLPTLRPSWPQTALLNHHCGSLLWMRGALEVHTISNFSNYLKIQISCQNNKLIRLRFEMHLND